MKRCVLALVVLAAADTLAAQSHAARPSAAKSWTVPRTPDGRPDLQGIWDFAMLTPLERTREFADKEFLNDDEVAGLERRAVERDDGRPPDDARTEPSVHPVWWLDYGKKVVGTRRTSLIVDPPNGRVPPLTPQARQRQAARAEARRARGPSDGPEDRGLFERCVTRGLPTGMMPGPYNNNVQFVQTPDHVVIFTEMIHDARIIPLIALSTRAKGTASAGPAHTWGPASAGSNLRSWLGDSLGRWEGDTLVVETTHFDARWSFRGSGPNLRLVERFTRTDAETIDYRVTLEDPDSWTKPWTVSFPLTRTDGPIYEYACHEGNYGLENILRGARATEKK